MALSDQGRQLFTRPFSLVGEVEIAAILLAAYDSGQVGEVVVRAFATRVDNAWELRGGAIIDPQDAALQA